VLHDGDNERLGLVVSSSHPLLGTIRQFGALFSFSDTPVEPGGPPPMVGQHTRDVLTEAGFGPDYIGANLANGVLYEPDGDYRWTV
jgi:crotonobetainyl-CoA:carnitine CoA-transferase CaiB-like acyl-CoA transferase